MKIQITFILTLLISGNFFAQDMSTPIANASTLTGEIAPEATLPVEETAKLHEATTTNQIANFLNKHLAYPEQMEKENLEGNLVIRVQLNKRGKIQHLSVTENELPDTFAKTALIALEGMNKISYGKGSYAGNKIVYVPIRFSF